ncbi:hypothetical protein [Lentzea sp. NPDC003310]|uniref:hypothetical protein n=1 Tax=Lentzea sp. NPDC003310 TaxID=3154447 RepID=UPI0033B280D7
MPNDDPFDLHWGALRPYISVVILECTSDDPAAAFRTLAKFLQRPGRKQDGRDSAIVALGDFDDGHTGLPGGSRTLEEIGLDQLGGFVRQQRIRPPWSKADLEFTDVKNDLTVSLRRSRLLAVHTDGPTQRRLLKWIDKQPRPPLRRVTATVLEGALLQGETKGLWLRGTHRRRTTKPDTKTSSGIRLQDTLDPFQDASFALGSARSELADDPERLVLRGIVGTTPRSSLVWFKASVDFVMFTTAVVELLVMIEKALLEESPPTTALSMFARGVHDLSEVYGAFEVTADHPDHLSSAADDELLVAAELLDGAITGVTGRDDSPNLILEVGIDGATCGELNVSPRPRPGGFRLEIGLRGEPTYAQPVQNFLDAAGDGNLLTVYYASGHTFTDGQMWTSRIGTVPFPNWKFRDFAGYDITQEKPAKKSAQDIHAATGGAGDRSLFGWVAHNYTDGWLICDDGAGEAADFLHIANDGTLSVIHVKGAKSSTPKRGIAVGAYQEVASQAAKNLVFNDIEALHAHLSASPLAEPACWSSGKRTSDRSEFLDMLDARSVKNDMRVVIVQPHVSEPTHDRLRTAPSGQPQSGDLLRLNLLDTLLNSARLAIAGAGGDLIVIGSTK